MDDYSSISDGEDEQNFADETNNADENEQDSSVKKRRVEHPIWDYFTVN